ncbi:acetoacetate decarboxylase family protein [Rhodococcus sp. G-MC3]|uniref:acetoacetate decarboxylase family protein n=1 Tax=Rhodococcus sp. G-MC3 TaxID=3046209 RepID=UPI0024BA0D3E|nr:acetoacetate decarboxylase family protein [Rhodococcus sp. G-MC3]MDJ0392653.1 acetoacetate decarboxylase family protein [Rhodococcus sp. G-MC3]
MNIRQDLAASLRIATPGKQMYHDAHYLSATMQIEDPTTMRRYLPSGVTLAKQMQADLFVAYFPHNPFHPGYLEAGLFVHVKAGFRNGGIHCPWMIVDNDTALILGREGAGYPKKLGQIGWDHTGDTISASAERRGTTLIDVTAHIGDRIDNPPPFLGRPHRNVIGLLGIPLPMLLAFTPNERPIAVHDVQFDLKVGGSESDPLDQMGLGDVVHARLHRVDITAPLLPPLPIRPIAPLFLARHLGLRAL